MRILLTANASYVPPRGGATRSNLLWLEHMAAHGHECRVVASALADSAGKRAQMSQEGLDRDSGAEIDPVAQLPSDPLAQLEGLPVQRISFEGISTERLVPLAGHLAQAEGSPLNREALKKSLRQLFATGLFETITAEGAPDAGGVSLIFRGAPRSFIGTVTVDGAKGPRSTPSLNAPANSSPALALLRPSSMRLWSRCARRWLKTDSTSPRSPVL